MSSFEHLPQYVRHDLVNRVCVRCGRQFEHSESVICTREGFLNNQPMIFLGELEHAKPCDAPPQ